MFFSALFASLRFIPSALSEELRSNYRAHGNFNWLGLKVRGDFYRKDAMSALQRRAEPGLSPSLIALFNTPSCSRCLLRIRWGMGIDLFLSFTLLLQLCQE
jgi:hypothetical protein